MNESARMIKSHWDIGDTFVGRLGGTIPWVVKDVHVSEQIHTSWVWAECLKDGDTRLFWFDQIAPVQH
jgi:hypothetical protein